MTLKLAGCILTNGQGRTLLLHRNTPKRTQWEIPGGKIDPGESAQQTVIREIAEELGVAVRLVRHLGGREFTEDTHTMHYTWYLGEITRGEPRIVEPDTFDGLRYFSRLELQGMTAELSPNTLNFLEAVAPEEL
jgi:8-oxo-dGTP diphosphatase